VKVSFEVHGLTRPSSSRRTFLTFPTRSTTSHHDDTTMSVQSADRRALPRKWGSAINKIKRILEAHGLLQVLDLFPSTTSFTFDESNWRGKKALKTYLGHRRQVADADGPDSFAESWAYIILEQCKIEPPVMIQDKGPELTGTRKSYRRPASSLLCRAQDLLPPFCFLQTELPANPRNKLCALILYYALVNGVSDAATRWNLFEDSLIEAIAYIEQRAEYQQWRSEQPDDKDATLSATSEAAQNDDSEEAQMPGGVVRSVGSSVLVRSGTALEKLTKDLGDERMKLLDLIPSLPVTIERHDNDEYWPFRLHLGTHDGDNVHVYRKSVKRRTENRILSHRGEWQFIDLSDVELLEPFACLMRTKNDLATRGNKIRYLVYYYLMLAENEGLTDDPKLQVSSSTMIATFVSVCRNLAEASQESTSSDEAQTDEGNGV
jgi:hypothetical protein